MQLSPIDDVRVSIRDIPSPPSFLSNLQAAMGERWTLEDLTSLLTRRATLHLSVLALATAVLAGGVLPSIVPVQSDSTPQTEVTDSLAVAVQNSVIARAIPFTNQSSDARYAVQPGDNLTAIAHQVGVSEEALLAYNGLASSDALNLGLQLRIPDLSKVSPDQLRVRDTAPHVVATLDPLPPQKPSPDLIIHQVARGENLAAIAQTEGVTLNTVLVSNNLETSSRLQVGQTLVIPALNGRLVATGTGDTVSGLAQKYASSPPAILAANKLNPKTEEIAPAQLVLVPSDPDAAVALRDAETTAAAARDNQGSPIKAIAAPAAATEAQAQDSPVTKAPAAPRPASSPGFSWPVTGYISTYFSWWHNGVDIVNAMGTPVHAVQAGKVVYSGWDNSGYGYMVRIDHGNGLQTLYGHASKLIAKAGDYVDQGQVIMLLGSTGRSTGPHVHFSVFQGGGYSGLNPLKYLP